MISRQFSPAWLYLPLALLMVILLTSPAWSHGGEEHSHADDPSPATASAIPSPQPRASAQSEEFELVAVLAEQKLTLYLDQYASNAPVVDARIELESGAFKAIAEQIEPGVYRLPGEAFAKPGKYPLLFSLQTTDSADLLTATLEVVQPAAETAQPDTKALDQRIVWGAAAALLPAGVGVAMLRRRK
jgi:hypothetical protein